MGTKQRDESDDTETTSETASITKDDVSKMINAALTGRFRSFESSLDKKLGEILAATSRGGKEPDEESEGDATPVAKSKPASSELDKKVAQLEKALEAERKKSDDERKQREAAEQRRLREEERVALVSALRKVGVTDEDYVEAASSMLYDRGQRIGRDESGKIIYKAQRDGFEEALDLEKGLGEWAQGAGKKFVAARAATGSGATPGKGEAPKGGKGGMSDHEAGAALQSILFGGGTPQR